MFTYNATFPRQRVSAAEKQKPSWYEGCIDHVIALGISFNDRAETETQLNILHGTIPNDFYKKTLNPYNSSNERYTRFPATMRNFDIMSDIIRRYVSEYFKGVHEFTVGSNNPEVVIQRKAKLREELGNLAQEAFKQEFERRYQELIQQSAQQGIPANQVNPQDAMPDPEQFVKDFNEKYIDDQSKQGQDMLDYIRSITNDTVIYLTAFFHYCSLGECYTYSEIRGEQVYKTEVPVMEAYPIPNTNFFVEDHDMFARKMFLSYHQIMDMFDDILSEKDRQYLDRYYNTEHAQSSRTQLLYSQYFETYPASCEKFNKEEREFFKRNSVSISEGNNNLFEVWHVVWRGEARRGILTYINEVGFQTQRVVDEGYTLNKEAGDISIEWAYEPQVYEGYRIGTRYTGIYPIKARPLPYERNGKLPYNGIMEVLPFMGKFSIIKLVSPYQIMRNIIFYHREMVIAKNKMLILLLPESLIASNTEDKLYKMAADNVLLVDDTEDSNSLKMQQVRLLNANLGDYIKQLTDLIESIKLEAREMVDMNMQRYGEIAQSAGNATTQEAITRSSMGSVIIVTMFDEMRKRDYQRDIDFAKLAYIDGLQTSFFDDKDNRRYISLDVNSFIWGDYSAFVKNDQKEIDKLNELKQWAFSAAQNGDLDMAIAAITGNNVTQIKDTVNKFMEIKRQHEEQMKQAEQMLKQEELQAKIAEIQAKGEEDRKTEALKYQYEMQLKYIDVDMSLLGTPAEDTAARDRLAELAEQNKTNIAQQKLNLDREKLVGDMYNKAADRQVKREEMENQLKIARTNKNKYDK
ncbi:MAG: hypothetical protein J6Y28_09640 [Acholeplasmatales bacterium]|nr:hypothetical protein [Methanobrevibacter sp.]MBP5446420.1 hypothetical protein [Acholeplasmatales bacterium]